MHNLRWSVLGLGLLLCGCAVTGPDPGGPAVTQVSQAYGEPASGFPTWYERMIHVLVNRARADPVTALSPCAACGANGCCADAVCFTAPRPPLWWREDLAHSARFHAQNLTATGCAMSHDSPCTLVANIGTLYPGTCDGGAACACQDAVSCGGGDDLATRLGKFGIVNWAAENIAGRGDPFTIFERWLQESTTDPTCQWSMENGHRWNILGDYTHLGVGGAGGFTVQDFHRTSAETYRIPAGAHYPETGTTDIQFRANWYASQGPLAARVNVDGTCHGMTLERGQPENSTWLATLSPGVGCHRYTFLFTDAQQQTVTYPDTGAFGLGCGDDWSSDQPAAGAGCDCIPVCASHVCGDDGCGGSCGTCAADELCQNGQCVRDCPTGYTACNDECVDVLTNAAHCGGCNDPCGAGEICTHGACLATFDGGVGADAGDGGPGPDGGGPNDSAGGGCSCGSGPRAGSPLPIFLLWLGWLVGLGRRRRRSLQ